MDFEQLEEKLKFNISDQERYIHTIGVVETAERLAKTYRVDVEKAKVAALLHDCAKFYVYEDFYEQYKITIDKEILKYPKIIHSFMGAYVAKYEYGVEDEDILNAIRYHTTGRPDMTILEKIIFLADAIEPNRENYPGLDKARKLTYEDLDKAMKFVLERTIAYVEERKLDLCQLTKDAYLYYKNKTV